ncbi:MAG: hypothetical protein J5943_01490 [Oribacterium sp.]|nr:hypothetical protein [Oribacterium sp.]
MTLRTCRSVITVTAGTAAEAEIIVTLLTLFTTVTTHIRTVLTVVAVIALLLGITLKTTLMTPRTGRFPIAGTAGIASVTPVIIALFTVLPTVFTNGRTVLTKMAFITLLIRVAFKTTLVAIRANGFTITVTTPVTAGTPEFFPAFIADITAAVTQFCTGRTGMALLTLPFRSTLLTGSMTPGASRSSVTITAVVAAFTPAVITIDAFIPTAFTDGSTAYTKITFLALAFRSAFHTGLTTPRTGRSSVTVFTQLTIITKTVIGAFRTLFSTAYTDCTGTICTAIASPALLILFALKTGAMAIRAGGISVTVAAVTAALTETVITFFADLIAIGAYNHTIIATVAAFTEFITASGAMLPTALTYCTVSRAAILAGIIITEFAQSVYDLSDTTLTSAATIANVRTVDAVLPAIHTHRDFFFTGTATGRVMFPITVIVTLRSAAAAVIA